MLKKTAFNFLQKSFITLVQFQNYTSSCKDINLFKVLSSVVGNKFVSVTNAAREQHSHDESFYRNKLPSIVVWPNSVSEVSEIAKVCTEHKVSMIPFGTGTGLEGGVSPLNDAICINLTNMNAISNLNIEDFDVQVTPGVTRMQLNHELKNTGLWFPVDPGADASLCGMVATGASGTNAVRYGTMKQNVLNLEVVLANGTVIQTGGARRCRKSSAGYNLTELFVGSEGTLGFITSATLRLHGIPEVNKSAVCSFPTILDAVNTAVQILQCNIPIARVELLDETTMKAVNNYTEGIDYKIKPTLFLEFHGSESSTQEQVEKASEIASLNDGSDFIWAVKQEEINKLWFARHNVLYALSSLRPGSKYYSTDVCVPITALPIAISHSIHVLQQVNLSTYGILGHVGDGNYHCLMMITEDEIESSQKAAQLIGKKSIELGGSCTGEHGIGLGKKKLLVEEVGAKSVEVMCSLKKALDPFNLMNPGKVL